MDRGIFRRDLLSHSLNFIRGVIPRARSPVLDAGQRVRPKARKVAVIGGPVKAVNAVRRLERDVHARFGHNDVKVVSNRVLCWNSVWLRSSMSEKELPHSHLGPYRLARQFPKAKHRLFP
jgi:hypothetical protein